MVERVLTEKQVAWAYEKWCLGYTKAQIANALYVCTRTIDRAFEARGLKRVRPVLVYDRKEDKP